MPYHAEPNSYPAEPFHQLPALHDLLRPHVEETTQGFGAITAILLQS
jgi:fatty acid desaturase